MNQIWFGLIWINPKESKTQWPIDTQKKQRNKKNKKPNNTNKKHSFPD